MVNNNLLVTQHQTMYSWEMSLFCLYEYLLTEEYECMKGKNSLELSEITFQTFYFSVSLAVFPSALVLASPPPPWSHHSRCQSASKTEKKQSNY